VRLLTDVKPVIAATTALLPVLSLSLLGDNCNVALQALCRGAGKQKVRAGGAVHAVHANCRSDKVAPLSPTCADCCPDQSKLPPTPPLLCRLLP